MENEGILIPGEMAEVEQRAREMGWVSKEEFEADENNVGKKWRPADEFIERGELFDTIKGLKRELGGLKKDFNTLAEYHRKVSETEYKRALETLKQERMVAAEEGDTKTVVEISDRIEQLKESQVQEREANQKVDGVHPAFPKWIESNPWYVSDEGMKAAADAYAKSFVMQNPGAPFEDVLTYVSEKMQDKVNKTTPKPKGIPTVDSGNNAAAKKGKSARDLPDDAREVMKTLVKRGVLTEKEYIDRFFDNQ